MPTGELKDLYQDVALTNVAAKRQKTGLIMPRIFPSLPVGKPTGKIYQLDPNNVQLKVQDTVRAMGAEAKALYSENPGIISYEVHDHSLTDLLPDEMRTAVDSVLMDEVQSVEGIMDALDLEREVRGPLAIKTALVSAGFTDSPTDKFNDTDKATRDPVAYLLTQINAMTGQIGVRPNMIVMDYLVAQAITTAPSFIERAKYTLNIQQFNAGVDSMALLIGAALSINEVIIAEGHVQNVAVKGATQSLSNIWSDEILIGYKTAVSKKYAGLGMQMTYSGVAPGGNATVVNGYVVERARNARRFSDEFFVHKWYQDKVINPNGGRWITDVLE